MINAILRDWLIKGRGGGLQNGRGSIRSFTPTKRGGGAEKVLAMMKGGTKSVGVVFTQ